MKAEKIAKWVIAIIIIFIIISQIVKIRKEKKETTTQVVSEKTREISSKTLMIVATTPCSPTFDYNFRIEADGPIWEKFPGIDQEIYWDGKSEQTVPDRKSGAVKITSADPKNPNIQIRIYLVN